MAKKKQNSSLNTICNIIWLIFGGIVTSLIWFLIGIILHITIIGIPFGKQCFKFAKLTLMPFGKNVKMDFGSHPIANVLWAIIMGWEMFLGYIGSGIVLCITIIGIPFGLQIFKLATLAIFPFGSKIK